MNPFWQVLLLALALGHGSTAEPRPITKPVNLLFIMTDQQRWDAMGCAGNPVLKTPNLDRFARQGARRPGQKCFTAPDENGS